MERFVVEGGHRLRGRVTVSGNKNEALPALAASLLTTDEVVIRGVPDIEDVRSMLGILRSLGCEVNKLEANAWSIRAGADVSGRPDPELCSRLRASILFAGPLLARVGDVELPPPGGDVIGRRRLDTHFDGFFALGASLDAERVYHLRGSDLRGAEIFLDEASVTATENVLMAAVLARGSTSILNAACEPHVQGLCNLLNEMGARIRGIGTNALVIEGVKSLHGADYTVGTDYMEAGALAGLAAVTRSDIEIVGARRSDMRKIMMKFDKLGIRVSWQGEVMRVDGGTELAVRPDLHGVIPKIDDGPWPQFPTDLMSIAIVCATQARGTVLFFEKMFDGRMFFVDHLVGMGAQIIQCDPHRVVVVGPSQLYGTQVESPDIRAGMAMLIASLCARGKTTIHNVRQIDRGFERIEQKLKKLGAHIERIG